VEHADLVFVDDWNLVRDDSRRVLGRMYREGSLVGPETATGRSQAPGSRAVDGTLADVLSGRHPGRIEKNQIVLSNPFGMGILDVAVAARVVDRALAMGLGRKLPI
jgi:ornithine cyclodeaminase